MNSDAPLDSWATQIRGETLDYNKNCKGSEGKRSGLCQSCYVPVRRRLELGPAGIVFFESRLGGLLAALVAEQDQVRAPPHAEFAQQIRDVELHGALGNIEPAGDFLVGEIFQ